MSLLVRAWNRTKMWSRDSISLASHLIQPSSSGGNNSSISRQSILVGQASQNNVVALHLLKAQKQINLIQYYGLMLYLRNELRWNAPLLQFSTNTNHKASNAVVTSTAQSETTALSPSSSDDDNNNNNASANPFAIPAAAPPKVGKIAFMITASMRLDLAALEYAPDQIKKLTPIQASLLLQNGVGSAEMKHRLPELQAAYEQEQQKVADDARRRKEELQRMEELRLRLIAEEEERQQQEKRIAGTAITGAEAPEHAIEPGTAAATLPKHESAAQVAPAMHTESSFLGSKAQTEPASSGTLWHQIIQRRNSDNSNEKDGDEKVIAMFLDQKEAEYGLQAHRELAEKRQEDISFRLQSVFKD
jgi:hypothetical protein